MPYLNDTIAGPGLTAGPIHDDGCFDLVVLDSIVHLAPDAGHFVAVVGRSLCRLRPGGSLAITDVRSLPLLEVSHTSAVLAEAEPGTTTAQLAERIRRRVEAEVDLAVDPRIFDALRRHFPEIEEVRVVPRPGADGECTRFRYDVVLTSGGEHASVAAVGEATDWPDWDSAGFSWAELEAEFSAREADVIAVRDLPNARVERFAEALRRIGSEPTTTLDELRALVAAPDTRELDPQALCDLGRVHGYHMEIDFSRHEVDGRFDLLAWRDDVPSPPVRRRPDDPGEVVLLAASRGWDEFTNRRERRGAASG